MAVFALYEVAMPNSDNELRICQLLRQNKTILDDFYEKVRKHNLLVDKSRIIPLAMGLIFTIFLSIFAFVRYETGYDYDAYRLIYDQSISLGFNELQVEPIYHGINYILRFAGIPFLGFLIVYTALSIIPKIVLIYSTSTYLMLSMLVYYVNCFIMYDFGVLRQAVAISLCAFACSYALNRRPWMFVLLIVVAMGFHVTAIVFLPFYFLARLRLNYRMIIIFVVVGGLGNVFVSSLLDNVYFNGLSVAFVFEKLTYYTNEAENTVKTGLSIGFYSKCALTLFYISSFLKNKEKTTRIGEIACIAYLISLVGFYILQDYVVIASRLLIYYKFSEIILLPDMIRLQKTKISKILLCLLVIAIQFYQLDRDLNQDYSDVLFPYKIDPDFLMLNWFFI
jgi:hypothetical protein